MLLPTWTRTEVDTMLDSNRTQHVITWSNSILQVTCKAVDYQDYPLVEWTVYFSAIGPRSTPILEQIQGLDVTLSRSNSGPEFTLNCNQGDTASSSSYAPYVLTLNPLTKNNFSPPSYSGKSCDGTTGWPYFNLQEPGGGMILAVGWPGQWASSFQRDAGTGLKILAGQQTSYFYLNPGEQVRSPLMALMFWQGGDVVRSQNIWRHWYIDHVIPRINGIPPGTIWQVQGDSVAQIQPYVAAGMQPDILWRDAGAGGTTWYPSGAGPYSGADQWLNTGTWIVDPTVYPNGFHRTSAQVNALGCKFLLWFEPERVGNTTNSFLGTNNPAWLLPATSLTVGAILNEGQAGAFNWLTNQFESLITANGINWYREDMNGNGPLTAWQANDATNRQGITENMYVQSHLAFWDDLLAMNPGLRIDCCGSGGRRNDLEAMRRAVPLDRSDYNGVNTLEAADGEQCQTYGLSSWLPFQGTGEGLFDSYSFRSSYMASFGMGGLNSSTLAAQQQAYYEVRKIAPIMLNGDYYPLTPYSQSDSVWMAWQFDWPAASEGCVQMFRRTNSPVASMNFKLQGLNPGQIYDVSNFDTGDLGWFTGSNLMTSGISLQLNPRGSALLLYTNATGLRVSATANPSTGLAPFGAKFNANVLDASGAPVNYLWSFGDGASDTNQSPTHVYTKTGKYIAQLTVSDQLGNTNQTKVPVVVANPTQSMNVSFSGYNNDTLTNFPVLLIFGAGGATNRAFYSQIASPHGWDLLFASPGRTQPLNYEIENWNTNGSSFVWVEAPLLNSNTLITVYWGDTNLASAPQPCLTNGSVWENGYSSVWHLGEVNGDAIDSTSNHAVGLLVVTNGVITQQVQGIAGYGYNFGGGYLTASAFGLPGGASPRTISAWFQKTNAAVPAPGQEIVGYGDNAALGDRFGLWIGGNGMANALGVENAGGGFTFPWSWDSHWHFVAAVLPPGSSDLNEVALYYDGIPSNQGTGSGPINTTTNELCFGALAGYHNNDSTYNFPGNIDEVRISNVARSSAWLQAEYLTVASNSNFATYGSIIPYYAPPPVASLSIINQGQQWQLSWPAYAGTGTSLQQSPDLIHWTIASNAVVMSGTNETVVLNPLSGNMFYRLDY